MKDSEVRELFLKAYNDLIASKGLRDTIRYYSRPHRNIAHRNRFEQCGRKLITPYGHEVRAWCKRAVCPGCSRVWGQKRTDKLVKSFDHREKSKYRFVTCIVGLTDSAENAMTTFRAKRRSFRNSVDYRRRKDKRWNEFGITGSLEIDTFFSHDYSSNHVDKREQYKNLGYDPSDRQYQYWVITIHALVHIGSISEQDIQGAFETISPIVHIEKLDERQSLDEAARCIGGYMAKVKIEYTMADGTKEKWDSDTLLEYTDTMITHSRGRDGLKLTINPYRKRQKVAVKKRYLEPMPMIY